MPVGGVAALLTMLLRQGGAPRQLGPVRCITIGTAAVMSLPLAEACREHVTSVILAADIVPKLSYASVEALLLEISGSSLLPRAAKGLGKTLSSVLVWWAWRPGAFIPVAAPAPLPAVPGCLVPWGRGGAGGGGEIRARPMPAANGPRPPARASQGLGAKPETPPAKPAWEAVKRAAQSPRTMSSEGCACGGVCMARWSGKGIGKLGLRGHGNRTRGRGAGVGNP